MTAVRRTVRFGLSFEFLSDPWLCAHQQAAEKSESSDGATPLVRCGRCIHTAVHTHLERMCCERIMVMV